MVYVIVWRAGKLMEGKVGVCCPTEIQSEAGIVWCNVNKEGMSRRECSRWNGVKGLDNDEYSKRRLPETCLFLVCLACVCIVSLLCVYCVCVLAKFELDPSPKV